MIFARPAGAGRERAPEICGCSDEHRVYCGSALDADRYAALMQGEKAAMVFTDPPYNVRIDGNVSGLGAVHHREFAMASGEMSEAEFTAFLTTAARCTPATAPRARSISSVWTGGTWASCWPPAGRSIRSSRTSASGSRTTPAWDRSIAASTSWSSCSSTAAGPIATTSSSDSSAATAPTSGTIPARIRFRRSGDEGNLLALHPTVKPVALVADAIMDCTARGDIVLDAFLGSGTTVIAAERTGRRCYGLEIDPLYVDTIIRRWQAFTRETPVTSRLVGHSRKSKPR